MHLDIPAHVGHPPAAGDGTRRPGMIVPAALSVVLLFAFSLFTFVDPPAGDSDVNRIVTDIAAWEVWTHLDGVLDILALLAGPFVSTVLTVVLAAVMAVRGRLLAAGLVLATLVFFTGIEILLRLRLDAVPWSDPIDVLINPRGRGLQHSSYPSGHVGRLVMVGGMAIACMPRPLWLPGVLVLLILSVLTTIQRVLVSAHTGSDGVGGLLLAGGLAAAFAVVLPLANDLQRGIAAWPRDRT